MHGTRLFAISAAALGGCLGLATIAGSAAEPAVGDKPAGDWERMRSIAPKGYVCGFANKQPAIDGLLDEVLWEKAPWTDEFVDIEGDLKPKPRFSTRAKMLWDKEYFYLAAELNDPHVWGTLTEHDAVIFQDNDFEVFIDPDGDHHEYYELELNALNTTWDLFLSRPYKDSGKADNSWEIPGLKSAVRVKGTLNDPSDQDMGWTVEMAIPWKVLAQHVHRASPPKPGDHWRVNFSRVEWQHAVIDGKYRKVPKTREDNWVWSPQGIIDMHRPERWGFVEFSGEEPGKTSFSGDASLPFRDLLMEVYHRQKVFQKQHGRWAGSFMELDYRPADKELADRLVVHKTDDGFEATVSKVVGGKTIQTWHVRQDSRLWSTTTHEKIDAALERAGGNGAQLQQALHAVPAQHRKAMEFLIAHMPDRDLTSLSAEFLLENVRLAYQAWDESPWKDDIPKEIFLNNVLPYASINESRDAWREDFRNRFQPLISGARTPSQAAALLNQKIFSSVNVRYSTKRPKADQSPYESIKSGTASCTGLAVLLIDACRAVGVPARFVGTPLWTDNSGNHSWVEVWDQGWHFTGAAEPAGGDLDKAWFVDRAATAKRDDPRNAIYAVSFQQTPLKFPLVWDRSIDYISAVNVTDRYVDRAAKPPAGMVKSMFSVLNRPGGDRCAVTIKLFDVAGNQVFQGITKDERFDANDYLGVYLPPEQQYQVQIRLGERELKASIQSGRRDKPFVWSLDPPLAVATDAAYRAASQTDTVASLAMFLSLPAEQRPALEEQAFAAAPLSKAEAADAARLLWLDHVATIRQVRASEMQARELTASELKMPFTYQVFGEKPASGRSMYISMHGGGGAPKRVNDRQWENQKSLYRLEEGVYVVPRAPTDNWNLWHEAHIDGLFDRLIENLIVFEEVDPNRVFLMGYSAGGDGVYQLAPRMADRWAAAAMMAGHPNETSPLGLRNVPFTIHIGALDSAYNRNKVGAQWEQQLAELHRLDPQGYVNMVKLHEGKKHWMDREDAVAIPWMARFKRDPLPSRVVWKQDDVVQTRFYWLAVDPKGIRDRAAVVASRQGQSFVLQSSDVDRVVICLNDEMADLDRPINVTSDDRILFQGRVVRTIATLASSLSGRGDPKLMFSAKVTVELQSRVEGAGGSN